MKEREIVLSGLREFRKELSEAGLTRVRMYEIIVDAIAYIEAQEPRLIQAEDFMDANGEYIGIPCWKEPKSPTRRSGWAVIVYGKWLADKGVCRYWTGRPTDEQKKEVKWE